MSEINQIVRHYRFKETVLITTPQHNNVPFETVIANMTNDGQYACIGQKPFGIWVKSEDIEVLGVLKTPSSTLKGLGPRLEAMGEHLWDGGQV